MTYRLQTVRELNITYRGGILDLAVNPSHIFYPEVSVIISSESQVLICIVVSRMHSNEAILFFL